MVMYIPQDLPTDVAEQGFKPGPSARGPCSLMLHCLLWRERDPGAGLLDSANTRSPVTLEVQINNK